MKATALHHVQINVDDVVEAVGFYRLLGMTERSDRPPMRADGAWLDVGGQQIHLMRSPMPVDHGQHFALEVADLDAAVAELAANGIPAAQPRSLGPGLPRQTAVHDPSGNRVELREPAAAAG